MSSSYIEQINKIAKAAKQEIKANDNQVLKKYNGPTGKRMLLKILSKNYNLPDEWVELMKRTKSAFSMMMWDKVKMLPLVCLTKEYYCVARYEEIKFVDLCAYVENTEAKGYELYGLNIAWIPAKKRFFIRPIFGDSKISQMSDTFYGMMLDERMKEKMADKISENGNIDDKSYPFTDLLDMIERGDPIETVVLKAYMAKPQELLKKNEPEPEMPEVPKELNFEDSEEDEEDEEPMLEPVKGLEEEIAKVNQELATPC